VNASFTFFSWLFGSENQYSPLWSRGITRQSSAEGRKKDKKKIETLCLGTTILGAFETTVLRNWKA
jgi:hypothetical protein